MVRDDGKMDGSKNIATKTQETYPKHTNRMTWIKLIYQNIPIKSRPKSEDLKYDAPGRP